MNTTATLKDWIISSVTTATAIESTLYGYQWEINTHQKTYPLFVFEPPNYTCGSIRTVSGIKRDYECNMYFFVEPSQDWEDAQATLEGYAFEAIAKIESKPTALFKGANNQYEFEFYEKWGADLVRCLHVRVIYTLNTCVNLVDE